MASTGKLLLELFIIFAGGKILAEVAERLRQPSVVRELLAGVLLGPSLLGLVHPSELTQGLAEVGAIFLLFTVGLKIKLRDLLQVGRTAPAVATLGVLLPLILGLFCMKMFSHGLMESIFVGAAIELPGFLHQGQ
jgi:Kef-type K+ transport system membrane component KefB